MIADCITMSADIVEDTSRDHVATPAVIPRRHHVDMLDFDAMKKNLSTNFAGSLYVLLSSTSCLTLGKEIPQSLYSVFEGKLADITCIS